MREANKGIKVLHQRKEVLRRAAAYLSQAHNIPLVRELAIDGNPVAVPGAEDRRQPYHRWLKCPVTDAELVAAYRANAQFDAHRDDPALGYRFLRDEAREAGESMVERTAWRMCSDLGWWSAFGKKRGRNGKKPAPPVHDDEVQRGFTAADAVNQLWLADITEHWPREGKLNVCAIKESYFNRILGCSIDSRRKSRLGVAALNHAVARRKPKAVTWPGACCRPTAGRRPTSGAGSFVHALNRHAMAGPIGRVEAAGDSAAMESFFSMLQKNVLDRRVWTTREELRIAIVRWIERT